MKRQIQIVLVVLIIACFINLQASLVHFTASVLDDHSADFLAHLFELHESSDVQSKGAMAQSERVLSNPTGHFGSEQTENFSACLLVMDDNHFLIEWLAYHYYSLPLRHLVVAVDPRSATSPEPILDRWREYGMDIELWTDKDVFRRPGSFRKSIQSIPKIHSPRPITRLHRARQKSFYQECMLHHKARNRTWTLLTDTDEFLLFNPRRQGPLKHIQPTNTILETIQQDSARNFSIVGPSPCVQIPRIRYGVAESPQREQDKMVPTNRFNSSNFMTMRWRKHAPPDAEENKVTKAMVDVSRVAQKEMLRRMKSIHLPVPSHCDENMINMNVGESMFLLNHYLGTYEQFFYRDDPRQRRSDEHYFAYATLNTYQSDAIRPWLTGFISQVGEEAAAALLKDVGVLEPRGNSTIGDGMIPKEEIAFLRDGKLRPTSKSRVLNATIPVYTPETVQYRYEIVDRNQNSTACAPISDKPPRLELLHIPKTGGSALEALAASKFVLWGLCHWNDHLDGHMCPKHTKRSIIHPIVRLSQKKYVLSNWHIPLHFFHVNQRRKYYDPYKGADLFVVVRHPYTRLLSEGNYNKRTGNTTENLNRQLVRGMRRVLSAKPGTKEYFYRDAHFIPQSDYLIGHENRRVNVIRYENLVEDFSCLMQRYKMDWGLPPRSNVAKRGFTLEDLENNTKRLARKLYAKDFEMFGYEP